MVAPPEAFAVFRSAKGAGLEVTLARLFHKIPTFPGIPATNLYPFFLLLRFRVATALAAAAFRFRCG